MTVSEATNSRGEGEASPPVDNTSSTECVNDPPVAPSKSDSKTVAKDEPPATATNIVNGSNRQLTTTTPTQFASAAEVTEEPSGVDHDDPWANQGYTPLVASSTSLSTFAYGVPNMAMMAYGGSGFGDDDDDSWSDDDDDDNDQHHENHPCMDPFASAEQSNAAADVPIQGVGRGEDHLSSVAAAEISSSSYGGGTSLAMVAAVPPVRLTLAPCATPTTLDEVEEDSTVLTTAHATKHPPLVASASPAAASSSSSNLLLDFAAVADQALEALEADYWQTLRLEKSKASAFAGNAPLPLREEEEERSPTIPNFADWANFASDNDGATNSGATLPPSKGESVAGDVDHSRDERSPTINTSASTGLEAMPANATVSQWNPQAVQHTMARMSSSSNTAITGRSSSNDGTEENTSNAKKGFADKYKEWEAQFDFSSVWAATMIVPTSHLWIPKNVLQAFASSPPNMPAAATLATRLENASLPAQPPPQPTPAQRQTSDFTRAATLVQALYRMDSLQRQDELCLHLIGCDDVETEDLDFLETTVTWLAPVPQCPPHIHIHLIGPNLPSQYDGHIKEWSISDPNSSLPLQPHHRHHPQQQRSSPRKVESVHVHYHVKTYDDFLRQQWETSDEQESQATAPPPPKQPLQQMGSPIRESRPSYPHLVLAYHAGMWGYSDWMPTLEYLGGEFRQKHCPNGPPIALVVTAYTLAEAEEDHHVLQEKLISVASDDKNQGSASAISGVAGSFPSRTRNRTPRPKLVWKPQVNPFGSHVERPTQTGPPGQVYRENAAWQGWRF